MAQTGETHVHAVGQGRRAVWSWAIYDFANSAYTTLIVTFIYAVYFTQQIASDAIIGTALWSRAVTASAVAVAVLSPILGAIADRGGYRRSLLMTCTAITVIGVMVLAFAGPGEVAFALTVFVISNVAYELCGVFYNSYLPDLAPREKIGRISGYGWALGYLGGLLAMAVALFVFIQPEIAPFGLDKASGQHVRATTILVGLWFGALSIPMFLWVKEPPRKDNPPVGTVVREALGQVKRTFAEVRNFKHIFQLLVARLVYNDGLVTIFAFGPIYAAETFDFTLTEVMYWGLALNLTAGIGSFAMGFMDDRIGGKKTILITLAGLIVGAVWAVTASTKLSLYLAGIWVGIFVGPNQAASRSLLGRMVPPSKEVEFFGFFAFSGKAMAFAGPLALGILTQVTESQRAGVASVIFFFVVGAILLMPLDEKAGIEQAGRIG